MFAQTDSPLLSDWTEDVQDDLPGPEPKPIYKL